MSEDVVICMKCRRKIPADAKACSWCADQDYVTAAIEEVYR